MKKSKQVVKWMITLRAEFILKYSFRENNFLTQQYLLTIMCVLFFRNWMSKKISIQ